MLRVSIFFGILLLIFSNTAFAEWTLGGATENTLVCASDDYDRGYHSVIPDGSGGFYVVWYDCRNCDTTSKDVYAQYYNSSGERQWTENGLQICSLEGGDKKPYVDSDGQGGIVVGWTNDDNNGAVQRVNASGTLMWPQQEVMYGYEASRCASDGAGGVIIVSEGYIQRVNAAGEPLWGPDPGDPDGGLEFSSTYDCGARVINDGSQGAIVVWYDDSSNIGINRVSSAGNLMWGDVDNPVFLNSSGNSSCPRIVAAGSGYYIIIWTDSSITNSRIYAQKINLNGEIQWAPGGILVTDQDSGSDHGLVTDGNGGGFVTWPNAADNNIYAQRIFPDGTLWDEPFQLNTSGDVDEVVGKGFGMTHAINNGFVTTWINDNNEVIAQRVKLQSDGTPELAGGDNGMVVNLAEADGTYYCARIASDDSGNAFVVWVDYNDVRDTAIKIYAQRIEVEGEGDDDVRWPNCFISSLFDWLKNLKLK